MIYYKMINYKMIHYKMIHYKILAVKYYINNHKNLKQYVFGNYYI